jgi:hypothetical protein
MNIDVKLIFLVHWRTCRADSGISTHVFIKGELLLSRSILYTQRMYCESLATMDIKVHDLFILAPWPQNWLMAGRAHTPSLTYRLSLKSSRTSFSTKGMFSSSLARLDTDLCILCIMLLKPNSSKLANDITSGSTDKTVPIVPKLLFAYS